MTKIANPAKGYRYSIELNGFNQALCQSVEIGEIELAKDLHGDGNKDIKTPGRVTVPDIVIEKLVAASQSDPFFWNWLRTAQNTTTGDAELPDVVKKSFFVHLLNPRDGSIRQTWMAVGAWPHKVKPGKLGDREEGNYMETVTLSVDDLIPQTS